MTAGRQGRGRGPEPGPEETGTAEYYRRRAAEYDDIYAKPERQADLVVLTRRVAELLAGYRVLELAAGTELVDGAFDAAFLGFFWSHVARRRLDGLLRAVAGRIATDGLLVALDTRFVGGTSHPVARRDVWGDSFQVRELSDGSRWEVRKNFPTAEEVEGSLRRVGGTSVTVEELSHYWMGWCRVPVATA